MGEIIMSIEWIRGYAKSMPHATESVQWGNDLVFKIGGKMFTVLALEPSEVWMSFKCAPEVFAALVERPGVIPAPYLARAHWVALESEDALQPAEIKRLVRDAYTIVLGKLPAKARAGLKPSQP